MWVSAAGALLEELESTGSVMRDKEFLGCVRLNLSNDLRGLPDLFRGNGGEHTLCSTTEVGSARTCDSDERHDEIMSVLRRGAEGMSLELRAGASRPRIREWCADGLRGQ